MGSVAIFARARPSRSSGPRGTRALPIDGFFQGYRRTARADDELITAVTLPRDPARRDEDHGFGVALVAPAGGKEVEAVDVLQQCRIPCAFHAWRMRGDC